MATEITLHELKSAFRTTGLWRMGWTFSRATQNPAIMTALRCTVTATRRKAARSGQPLPAQQALI